MPTNYPSALDNATTLGPTFINDVAVTDQARQIDATLRTNIKDAVLALEARIGITSSTVTSSLSWATLSAGGTDNQGLRIAGGGSTTWPGTVAEAGIFLDAGSGFLAYHRSGESTSTFYQLASAASAMSLQNSYAGGNTITTSGANDIAFALSATENFTLTHTADSNTQIATTARTATDGLLDINCLGIAATGVMAVNVKCENSTNNQEIGGQYVALDNSGDLADTEVIYGYSAQVDMSGDGPALGLAMGAAFYGLAASFSGANNYESAGLLVDSTYDWGVYSNAPLYVNSAASSRSISVDSDPGAGEGSITVANAASAISRLIQCYDGTVATIGTTAIERFTVLTTGTTSIYANGATDALYAEQRGAGNLFYLYDRANTAARFVVTKAGDTTITAAAASSAALTLIHETARQPFIAFDGTYSATAANGNITDEDAGGAVVGPGTNTWTFNGMARVEVVSGGGGVPAGDYWVPLYS